MQESELEPLPAQEKLVVAISSRALFDLDQGHEIFTTKGLDAYVDYQVQHEDEILEPGIAFPLVQKLLALNGDTESPRVEVILLSRNSGDTGLRVFNSIQHHGLTITRAAFTNGARPYAYIPAFGAHLFLSADADDVTHALDSGYAAATILPAKAKQEAASEELRIAFDGDAVLFSDEAERVFKSEGLEAFSESETRSVNQPLPGGPFKGFLAALHRIQSSYPAEQSPIRTALVTARAAPAHKRVILTLRHWDIRIDEALFLGGREKGAFLRAFGADIFFDDQRTNVESASAHVTAGHVPHGVANEP